jgi:hypothetical protein
MCTRLMRGEGDAICVGRERAEIQASEAIMYDMGEEPGRGTYRCARCDRWRVTLDKASDRLPPCGDCGPGRKVKYRRV